MTNDEAVLITSKKWLKDVEIGPTAISNVRQGEPFTIRGVTIEDCIRGGYEYTCWLLLEGESRHHQTLDNFKLDLHRYLTIPTQMTWFVRETVSQADGRLTICDLLRTCISHLQAHPIQPSDANEDRRYTEAKRLIAASATIVAQICLFLDERQIDQDTVVVPEIPTSFAESFLRMLKNGRPDSDHVMFFDRALVLYAEHGFAASTIAVRVTASTGSDAYSGIAAGVGALQGWLHGGANKAVMDILLNDIHCRDHLWRAAMKTYIDQIRAAGGRVPGFGNPVHRGAPDPRVDLLRDGPADGVAMWEHRSLGAPVDGYPDDAERKDLFHIADVFAEQVKRIRPGENNRLLYPNIDLPAGVLFHQMGLSPTGLYPAIFACARMPGWLAHYYEHDPGTCGLMRPGGYCQDNIVVKKQTVTAIKGNKKQ